MSIAHVSPRIAVAIAGAAILSGADPGYRLAGTAVAAAQVSSDPGATGASMMTPGQQLAFTAGGLRLVGAHDIAQMVKALDPNDVPAAAPLIGLGTAEQGALLARFIAGSTQHVVANNIAGTVGWWNPLADAWIVTHWRREGDRWTLTGTAALLGSDLSGVAGRPGIRPRWTTGTINVADRLVAETQDAVTKFRAQVGTKQLVMMLADKTVQRRAWAGIALREDAARVSLIKAALQPGYARYPTDLYRTLIAGVPAIGPGAERPPLLAGMTAEIRVTMRPTLAFRTDQGLAFALQSPFSPGLVILARFASRAGRDAEAVSAQIVPVMGGQG